MPGLRHSLNLRLRPDSLGAERTFEARPRPARLVPMRKSLLFMGVVSRGHPAVLEALSVTAPSLAVNKFPLPVKSSMRRRLNPVLAPEWNRIEPFLLELATTTGPGRRFCTITYTDQSPKGIR